MPDLLVTTNGAPQSPPPPLTPQRWHPCFVLTITIELTLHKLFTQPLIQKVYLFHLQNQTFDTY